MKAAATPTASRARRRLPLALVNRPCVIPVSASEGSSCLLASPAPGLISAELCLKFFDVHKLIAISLEGRNSDCLTAFFKNDYIRQIHDIYLAFTLFSREISHFSANCYF